MLPPGAPIFVLTTPRLLVYVVEDKDKDATNRIIILEVTNNDPYVEYSGVYLDSHGDCGDITTKPVFLGSTLFFGTKKGCAMGLKLTYVRGASPMNEQWRSRWVAVVLLGSPLVRCALIACRQVEKIKHVTHLTPTRSVSSYTSGTSGTTTVGKLWSDKVRAEKEEKDWKDCVKFEKLSPIVHRDPYVACGARLGVSVL